MASRQGASQSLLVGCALALLLLAAAGLRLHGLGRGLEISEAWVANSILADRWAHVFYYPPWLQTTPPLFLVLARAAKTALGTSNEALRVAPLALGVLSIVLVALLAREVFPAPLALVCVALVAFSPEAIFYSKALKQYTGDVASTALLLLAAWGYRKRPDARGFAWLLAAFACALMLSYTAVVLAPTALVLVAFTHPERAPAGRTGRAKAWRIAGFLAVVGTVEAAVWALFILPNWAPQLSEFWRPGFPAWASPKDVAVLYGKHFLGLWIALLGRSPESRAALVLVAAAGAGLFFAAAVVGVVRPDRRPLVLMSLGPMVTVTILNALHLYPASPRLFLFLLPCLAIAITLVLEELAQSVPARRLPAGPGRLLPAAVASLAILAALAAGVRYGWEPWTQDVEGAVRYLKEAVRPGDLVYVHASVVEPAKLYLRLLGWPHAPLRFGDTGAPCCPRDPAPEWRDGGDAAAREAAALSGRVSGALWLLLNDSEEFWTYVGRDDRALFAAALRERGWRPGQVREFPRVVLYEFLPPGQ